MEEKLMPRSNTSIIVMRANGQGTGRRHAGICWRRNLDKETFTVFGNDYPDPDLIRHSETRDRPAIASIEFCTTSKKPQSRS